MEKAVGGSAGGGGSGGGKTLDALSKEDLIKFSKKQAVNVSQMKTKIADLQKVKQSLSAEKAKAESESGGLREEVSGLREEAAGLREKNDGLNRKLENATASHREETDCLKLKLETVTASYLAVVRELDAVKSDAAAAASHDDWEAEKVINECLMNV